MELLPMSSLVGDSTPNVNILTVVISLDYPYVGMCMI